MTAKTRKEQIEEMLRDDPNDPFLRYGLAMEYISAGDDATASRCLQELLQVVPAYVQAGQVLVRLNKEDEARAMYQSGIDVARKKGDLHAAGEMEGFLMGL